MNNKNSLVSTAMLSYLWNDEHKDNIDLLKPFVIHILHNDYNINDVIDLQNICEKMKTDFSFDNMPIAVIRKIIVRLCKKENILQKLEHQYILCKDLSKEAKNFTRQRNEAAKEMEFVVSELRNYLVKHKMIKQSDDITKVEQLLNIFLEKNGYIIIKNIDRLAQLKVNDGAVNYRISSFIMEQAKEETPLFQSFYHMIQGFMITSAIYLQIENNNKETLKKTQFYFDAPLMLNVLGYKTTEQNKMAEELVNLLIQQGAKIKCFEHNCKEVEYIIDCYKNNLSRTNTDKTLEALDLDGYNESDVEMILASLRDNIKAHNIEIVETPDYNTHDYVIGFEELLSYLKENYRNEVKEKTLYNDVNSINAINMIRKGKEQSKIEDCKAVFVTLNYELVRLSKSFFDIPHFEKIGHCISDNELTIILWLKTYQNNPDLPKLKLITNALAAFEPSPKMLIKIKETTEKMEKSGSTNTDVILNTILSDNVKKADLMEITGGDENNINEQTIIDVLQMESNKEISLKAIEIQKYKEKADELQKRISQNENENNERYLRCQKYAMEKADNNIKIYNIILNVGFHLLFIAVIMLLLYVALEDFSSNSNKITVKVIALGFSIIGYLSSIIGPFKWFKKAVDNYTERKHEKLYDKYYDEYTKII